MYDLVGYGAMIADRGRTSAYARALERLITPGAVVLDIGTGPGILALLACRAGAARVYAVEPADVIEVAREVAAANGYADRISFIQNLSTTIDLPERVDGVVADLHGMLPTYRQGIVSMIDARNRLLKPGGWLVPSLETMWAAVVSCPAAYEKVLDVWTTEYGFDLSAASQRAANQMRRHPFAPGDLVTDAQCWATLDYAELTQPNVAGQVSFRLDADALAHGLAVWFDSETAPGVGFSNAPASESHIFGQLFFPWPEAAPLSAGDTVDVRLRADLLDENYVLTWATTIRDGAGHPRRSHRQSSVFADLLNSRQLRKRSAMFVPDPDENAPVARRILELMERKTALGDIATAILAEFPSVFEDWNAAMGRVGLLSTQYSR